MLAQIKEMSLDKNRRNPHYRVLLQCPDGSELFIHFNYTYRLKHIGQEMYITTMFIKISACLVYPKRRGNDCSAVS